MFSKVKPIPLNLDNDFLEKILDKLDWKYQESYNAEIITIKQIQETSLLLSVFLHSVDKFQINGKKYYRQGNLIFRIHKDLPRPIKQTQKKSFTVTKRVS